MFTGQDSTEVQEEEIQDMLFTQTVSEQATFTLHEEDFSVPLLLQEPIYNQINFDDFSQEVQSFEDFSYNQFTANFKLQSDPLKRISPVPQVKVNVHECKQEEVIKKHIKEMSNNIVKLKQDEMDLNLSIKVQGVAVHELFHSFKQNKISEKELKENLE